MARGLAYEGGGAFRRAGDCFMKANEAELAAENYERAGEFYGAGFALVHAKHWEEAVRIFQKLPESSPHFGESRQLLGRAFYELKDYAHCAATLENHLLGERVRKDNIDYFWMLALAYEQLGKLEASREVLLKIRSVDVEYRDVAHRLQRATAADGGADRGPPGSMPTMATPALNRAIPVMSMVKTASRTAELENLARRYGRRPPGRDTQLDHRWPSNPGLLVMSRRTVCASARGARRRPGDPSQYSQHLRYRRGAGQFVVAGIH